MPVVHKKEPAHESLDELAFDPAGWLVSWASGVTTDAFLYDGEGNRVELAATESTSATTTSVAGGLKKIATNGATTTLTTYFPSVSALPSFTEGEGDFAVQGGGYRPVAGDYPTRKRLDRDPLNRGEYLLRAQATQRRRRHTGRSL